jgi:hypothetical protein
MRPQSAGIRFHTREEDICCSKPIDWDGIEDDMKSKRMSPIDSRSNLQLSKLLRPASAPLQSIRLAATTRQLPLFNDADSSASASQNEGRSQMLDESTRGYKGLVTYEQLARCPTPRLNLFSPPPIAPAREAAARPKTAGECTHYN